MALAQETTNERPEQVAFAYGRAWFAGTSSKRWGTTLFYSQVLVDINRAGKCYQDADPTATDINSLIDSDGGTIKIPEIGRIMGMEALSSTLVILADNGVWAIVPGSDGFTPLSFFTARVTKTGCVSTRSIIQVDDTIVYAAEDGLYQIGGTEKSNKIVANNMTEEKVNTHYTDIGLANLQNSVSVYNPKEKVYSLYHGSQNNLNKCLNIRLRNGAWYPYEFDTDSNSLSAVFNVAYPFYSKESGNQVKFLNYSDDAVTPVFSIQEYNDVSFKDFGDAEIAAHLELAPLTLDNPQFDKSAIYCTHYFAFTEDTVTGVDGTGKPIYSYPSGALMTPKWEWNNTSGGSKIGRQRQVYRFREPLAAADGSFDMGATVVTSRDKVRGHGKALGIRYDAESGKDMRLIGLTLPMSMDGQY